MRGGKWKVCRFLVERQSKSEVKRMCFNIKIRERNRRVWAVGGEITIIFQNVGMM